MNTRRLTGILVLGLSAFAISFPSAAATADTGHPQVSEPHAAAGAARSDPALCTIGSSQGNVTTCMSWANSGTRIEQILGSATVSNVGRKIKICILSNVKGTIACDRQGYFSTGPHESLSVRWAPNRPERAGVYCVRTWRQNGNGTVTLIGDVCTTIASE